MINISVINNNSPLSINSISMNKYFKLVKFTAKINTKIIDSNNITTNIIKNTDFMIKHPKPLTSKFNQLKQSSHLLKNIKVDNNIIIRKIIIQKITNLTNNNILKSYLLKHIRVTKIKNSLVSFFNNNNYRINTINMSKKEKLNQIIINKKYYISFKQNNNYSYKSTDLNPQLYIIKYNDLNVHNKFNLSKNNNDNINNNNNYNISLNNEDLLNKNIIKQSSNNNLFDSILKLVKNSKSLDNKINPAHSNYNSSDKNKNINIRENILISKLRRFINVMTKFYPSIANNQSIYYNFNKSNKLAIQPFINASNILKLSFLTMGCLISRPVFKIVYTKNRLNSSENYKVKAQKKIIIQLFYFVRFKSTLSTIRLLILKLLANPNIIDPGYKVNSRLKYADKTKFKNNLTVNKLLNIKELINNLNKLKRFNKSKGFFARNANKFQSLAMYLTNLFGSEVQLDLVRLYKPYYDSNILVQDLNLKSYNDRFFGVVTKLFNQTNIKHRLTKMLTDEDPFNPLTPFSNAYLTGVKVRLGGRSFQQRIVARQTVQEIQRGSLSKTNFKYKQSARFTGKVKRGSYSFTVTLGHTF